MTRDLICLMCPNGCRLTVVSDSAGGFQVSGNRCEKGLGFVRHILRGEGASFGRGRIIPAGERRVYPLGTIQKIGALWDLSVHSLRPHLIPEGSPERTLFRVVIEDAQGELFTIEEIPSGTYHHKMRIIRTLEALSGKGLKKVIPYRMGQGGQYIQPFGESLWQLVPFVTGEVLDRERYLYEGWRARELAAFLFQMKGKAAGLSLLSSEKPFSLKKYIYDLFHQIERHELALLPRIKPVLSFLEERFMPSVESLPLSFCHGDFHPLNMIWGKDRLNAVIDWEFLGEKPEMYDAANMVGCLGMEHPSSLVSDLVVNFIRELKTAGLFSDISWEHFPDLVLALRFAWLSEWLRKKDTEMIALELDYMDLWIDEKSRIIRAWQGT